MPDLLRLAVVGEQEVVFLQAGHQAVHRIGNRHRNQHQVHILAERLGVRLERDVFGRRVRLGVLYRFLGVSGRRRALRLFLLNAGSDVYSGELILSKGGAAERDSNTDRHQQPCHLGETRIKLWTGAKRKCPAT